VIAPADQLRWLVRRLGPLAFGNPTLMLAAHKSLSVVDPGVTPAGDAPQRAQHVNIQCPKCRRKTAFTV
jgi:hypothetical protein